MKTKFTTVVLFIASTLVGCAISDETPQRREYSTAQQNRDSDSDSEITADTDFLISSDSALYPDTSATADTNTIADTNTAVEDSNTATDTNTTDNEIPSDQDSNADADPEAVPTCTTNSDCIDGWCDTDAMDCTECNDDTHCGSGCVTCGEGNFSEFPYCSATGDTCVECKTAAECPPGNYCTSDRTCVQCNIDGACGNECAICGKGDFEFSFRCDGNKCVECLQNEDCSAETPICDRSTSTCHQCVTDADCRSSETAFRSPLGLCTPDKTCTCLVNTEEIKGQCVPGTCPMGSTCAEDFPGSSHFVCLANCAMDADTSSDIHSDTSSDTNSDTNEDTSAGADTSTSAPIATLYTGLSCTSRSSSAGEATWVWAPVTTCYAFDQFGEDCSQNESICSVYDTGDVADGTCIEGTICSYTCWDSSNVSHDEWCPSSATGCGDATPNIYCQ